MIERSFDLDRAIKYSTPDISRASKIEEAKTDRLSRIYETNESSQDFDELLTLNREIAGKVGEAIEAMLANQDTSLEGSLVVQNIIRVANEVSQGIFGGKYGIEIDEADSGRVEILRTINRELILFLLKPWNIDGFREGQWLVSRYLEDQYYDNPKMTNNFGQREIKPEDLSQGQVEIMKRIDLKDYENSTANTLLTLTALFHEVERNMPDRKQRILEIGCGQGRIAIPLAALGHQVLGLDISSQALTRLKQRAENASRVLLDQEATDRSDMLPWQIKQVKDRINLNSDHDDYYAEHLGENIVARRGDFFELTPQDYEQKFGPEKADCAVIMWHTFGFAGNHEGQMKLLKNIYNNLKPGGRVIIEMPDRNFGPYARAIRKFYAGELEKQKNNPEYKIWPYGTLVDAPAVGDNPTRNKNAVLAPRYFPSNQEMITVLEEAGFDIVSFNDYFVANSNNNSLKIKENLWVAKKPYPVETLRSMAKNF